MKSQRLCFGLLVLSAAIFAASLVGFILSFEGLDNLNAPVWGLRSMVGIFFTGITTPALYALYRWRVDVHAAQQERERARCQKLYQRISLAVVCETYGTDPEVMRRQPLRASTPVRHSRSRPRHLRIAGDARR